MQLLQPEKYSSSATDVERTASVLYFEQLNIVDCGAALISLSVTQANPLEKRRFVWNQDICS